MQDNSKPTAVTVWLDKELLQALDDLRAPYREPRSQAIRRLVAEASARAEQEKNRF